MSRPYALLLIIVAGLGAGAAFLPLITGLKLFLPQNPTPKETLDTLITFLGVFMTLSTIVFGAGIAMSLSKAEANDARIERFLEEIRGNLGLTKVELLHDYAFYPHLRYHTELAERSVDISYFELLPPGEPESETKQEYYRNHFKLIRDNKKVVFRRIIRESPLNKEWIKKIVENELCDASNAELAIYKEQGAREMPLPLSVQIIDAKKVWLVAIATHGSGREPRDIFVENHDIAAMMEKYYERLWSRSEVIFRHGKLTIEGSSYLYPEKEA